MSDQEFNDAPDSSDAPDTLDLDLRKLQDERDALFSQLARVQADFRNAQKRMEQEKQRDLQYANSRLIKVLLPAIDNFERALEVKPDKTDVATLLKGMQIVHDALIDALKGQQVEVIAPAKGDPFDANVHEALMQQPSKDFKEPTVLQTLQKGYSLMGRTLRPAQVVVSQSA